MSAALRSLFSDQRHYIEAFRNFVFKHSKGGTLTSQAVETIVAVTAQGRNGWPLEGLIGTNARAVTEEYSPSDP